MAKPFEAPAARNLRQLRDSLVADGVPIDKLARMKNAYLRTPNDDVIREAVKNALKLVALPTAEPDRIETRGVALTAPSGYGKSRVVNRVLSANPLFAGFGDGDADCPAIRVRCPGSCTLGILGVEIVKATGFPLRKALDENEAWRMVRERLPLRGIYLVFIDEIGNLIKEKNQTANQASMNNLKSLMNNPAWPVVLVITGVPKVKALMGAPETDGGSEELFRRLSWMTLDGLRSPGDNAMVSAYIAGLCKVASVDASEETLAACVPRLIHSAVKRRGIAIELALEAVEAAMDAREPLSSIHFGSVYAKRTSCSRAENPFLAEDWPHVDVSIILRKPKTAGADGKGKDR